MTIDKLSPFVNQGLTSGRVYPVGGQATIINNSVNYIINDLDILASSTTASGSSQTLYFNPDTIFDPAKLTFTIGDYVKITNNNNFTEVVQVTTSTVNSITFDLVANLPVGGLSTQLASDDLFPTTSVLANYYANLSTTGIWINPTNPRENLALSQMGLVSRRSRQYYIDRELSDTLPLLSPTTNSLSVFDDVTIPGDFKLPVTGQTSEIIYNTVLSYVNDLDILSYTTATVNVKILSFPNQDATPFASGSTVRIINTDVKYTQEFTVINGTNNSVSILNTKILPVGGLTIEKSVASVYPQSFVNTKTSPTNARENLYYFNISPGLRAERQYFVASADSSLINGNVNKRLSILQAPTAQLSVAKLSSTAKLTADSTTLRVNTLRLAIKLATTGFTESRSFVSTPTQFYSQSSVSPQGAPKNARENFFYFNLAPGLRANSSILQGVLLDNNFLPTNLGLVKQPQSNLVDIGSKIINSGVIQKPIVKLAYDTTIFTINKLSNVSRLKAVDSKFKFEQLDIFKTPSNKNQVFYTPLLDKLSSIAVIRADRSILTVNKLSNVSRLKAVDSKFKFEQLDIFKTPSNKNQVFYTPVVDKLSSTAVIRADRSILTVNNLKAMTVIKEVSSSKQLSDLDIFDNYIDQIYVRPIAAATNASERFYYFNLAPGYRRNFSIQDGAMFGAPNSIIKNDRLELFDNIGYQLDLSRIYSVSGQTTGVTANTLLSYQYDLDILTTTTVPINSVTIFFGNIERTALAPFLTGDTVYVTKNQGVVSMPVIGFVFTVIANTFNSITIAKPADWDNTWSFNTIQLTGAEYYPRTKVKTIVAPTNAREALYYTEISPGIRTNSTISYGNSLIGEQDKTLLASVIEKDTWKLRDLAVKNSDGQIFKFITGDGKRGANGFIDTSATKKEPIQFWN